ncbi:MAG: phosphoribosylformylglycinamidine cyclo-ligase [Planctomycetes bacterium]|nr:phosphoribosylformylglycinamidine cyclo-ligase [Planctomycetota bacterium]
MAEKTPINYKDAGVNIDAQDEALSRSKQAIRESFTPGVMGDVGSFGGLFDLAKVGSSGDILVASADGVGTKLEVAKMAGIHHTVGRDLVQHCINDILVQGARPLFFMDYVGTGALDPTVVSDLIRGCAEACRDNGLALLGGETAEMPGLYAAGDFDLVGFIVGSVPREQLLDGSRVRPGQKLIGLASDGLHTNGYSLARQVVFKRLGLTVHDKPAALGGETTVGEALLAPHRSYLKPVMPLLEQGRVAALAHITGGGLLDNLPRVLGDHDAFIDRGAWQRPALFQWLCDEACIDDSEAYRVFNMGIGLVLLVDGDQCDTVKAHLVEAGETVYDLGEVREGTGRVQWLD